MGLAEKEKVIRLTGSPSPEYEQAFLNIDEDLADADKMVYDYTKKRIWLPDDEGYSWAERAANLFAAASILQQWGDSGTRSDLYEKGAWKALETLRQIGYGIKDGDNPIFVTSRSQYKSIANNSKVGRYLSRNAFGGEYDW